MCDPQRFDHFQNNCATDYVSLRVLPVRIVGLDVELGVVVRLGRQRRPEPGEEGSARGWRRRFGGSAHLTGTHNLDVAHIMRLRAVVGECHTCDKTENRWDGQTRQVLYREYAHTTRRYDRVLPVVKTRGACFRSVYGLWCAMATWGVSVDIWRRSGVAENKDAHVSQDGGMM